MTKSKRIGRRSFLAGAGGVCVSLPLLDIMRTAPAYANGGAPCRFLVALQGMAQARANSPTSPGFAPLADLHNDLMFVTGLNIDADRTPGPGQRPPGPFHPTIINPLVSGVRSTVDRKGLRDTTSDQIVADAWAGQTPVRSLAYRVQKEAYIGGEGAMSVTANGQKVTPIASPQIAWQQLFAGGVPGATPPPPPGNSGPSPALVALQQDKSVLDTVLDRARSLIGIASTQDKLRLQQHFEEIRALERRIATQIDDSAPTNPGTPPPPPTGSCVAAANPGADPNGGGAYAWSDETARGQIFVDLIAMAFACDLTRVVSWMLSYWQSKLSSLPMTGVAIDVHECTHSNRPDKATMMANVTAWHVDLFGQLVRRLRDLPEGGGSVLDNSVLVMLFEAEGAHGYNNNTSIVAGRPDVLRIGETVAAQRAHPAQLLSSAMHAVGVQRDLGEVPGQIGGMFR